MSQHWGYRCCPGPLVTEGICGDDQSSRCRCWRRCLWWARFLVCVRSRIIRPVHEIHRRRSSFVFLIFAHIPSVARVLSSLTADRPDVTARHEVVSPPRPRHTRGTRFSTTSRSAEGATKLFRNCLRLPSFCHRCHRLPSYF